MYYTIKSIPPSDIDTDCLILPIWANQELSASAGALDALSQGYITQWINSGDMDGALGRTLMLYQAPHLNARRVLLIGCGDKLKFTPTQFQQVITSAFKYVGLTGAKQCAAFLVDFNLDFDKYWQYRQAILSTEQTFYQFNQYKTTKEPFPKALAEVTFLSDTPINEALAQQAKAQALAIADSINLACTLANTPANICTPSYLAEEAMSLANDNANLKVSVMDKEDMEKHGMNAILAVSKGADQPPKLITIDYKGGAAHQKPIIFVGKGVTFDSGGISIKPGAAMDEMKYDMCGAADVLAILKSVAQLKLPLNVIGVMACCENLPDGKSYKPGDIITTSSGQTIEILNTDAEGRVLLSDALTYCEKFNPELVIDIATLTGAIIIALGDKATGLMTNDDDLAQALIEAGQKSWDRVWRLPLWEEYQEQIKSPFADMANIGSEGGKSITAACLLSRFAKNYRWAHLDIAGTAWRSGKEKGATGRVIPLLVQFLLDRIHP